MGCSPHAVGAGDDYCFTEQHGVEFKDARTGSGSEAAAAGHELDPGGAGRVLFGDDGLDVVPGAYLSAHVVAMPADATDGRTTMNHRGDVRHHTQSCPHGGQQVP